MQVSWYYVSIINISGTMLHSASVYFFYSNALDNNNWTIIQTASQLAMDIEPLTLYHKQSNKVLHIISTHTVQSQHPMHVCMHIQDSNT